MTEAPSPPTGIVVRALAYDPASLDAVAGVASDAFADDPFFTYLMPSPRLRRRGLRLFFRSIVATSRKAAVGFGAHRMEDDRLVGVAVFLEPGGFPLPALQQVRQLLSAGWALAPRPPSLVAGARYQLAVERAHPRERIWYLQLLAVDPALQRGGIGGALQQQVYPAADREGLPSYLETQKEANLAYYRRFGYDVDHELRPVRSGPPLWTMRRAPRVPDL